MLEYLYGKMFDWSQTFSCVNTSTFSNLLILYTYAPMKMEQSVPKRRHIKFRLRGITQEKANCSLRSVEIQQKNLTSPLSIYSFHKVVGPVFWVRATFIRVTNLF